jgi:hypothetical protein
MRNPERSIYRDHAITVHCSEIDSCGGMAGRYRASFMVDGLPNGATQAFPKAEFSTSVAAGANARMMGMTLIDASLSVPDGQDGQRLVAKARLY